MTFRVARVAFRVRQIPAIWASARDSGRPWSSAWIRIWAVALAAGRS